MPSSKKNAYRLCRHVKTDGLQCQSPAMHQKSFCFYHHTARCRHRAVVSSALPPDSISPAPLLTLLPSSRHASLSAPAASTYAPTLDRDGNFSMEPLPSGFYPPAPGPAPAPASSSPSALPSSQPIDLGLLEDAESIQVAISVVLNALAGNQLDGRRATALLYGLQLASANARNVLTVPSYGRQSIVRETVPDAHGQPIAMSGLRNNQVWVYDNKDEDLETGD